MKLTDWFDIKNLDHMNAYKHLQEIGFWPESFIPEYVEMDTHWHVIIQMKMADAYVELYINK